ncbi:TPA: MerR family transcriptional regulator, partial [Streptococcus agalactiae]
LEILKDERDNLEDRLQGLQEALNRLNHKIDNYQNKVVPREQELFDPTTK